MKNWTEDEIFFLKNNYKIHGRKWCAEKLNRLNGEVKYKAKDLKLIFKEKITIENLSQYNIIQESEKIWVGYKNCSECNKEVKYQSTKRFYVLRNIKKAIKKNTLCSACCRKGEKNHFFGKKHLDETKAQVSKSRIGKCLGKDNAMSKKENRDKVSKRLKEEYDSGRLDNLKEGYRNGVIKTIKSGKMNCKPISKPEIEIKQIFINKGYKVSSQLLINTFRYDLFLEEHNVLIEYNGDYWHCNPNKYQSEYFNQKKNMFAHELWTQDERKKELAENNGYKLFIIWEQDYKFNKESEINKIIEQLNIKI